MESLQQGSGRGNSNRIVAVTETPPSRGGNEGFERDVEEKPGWRKSLEYVGPGFLVSMAYIDPGTMETDLQAGANHGYQLLWVMLIGMIFAVIIQYFAANLGVSTGKHLAELCRDEYPRIVKYCLWVMAELAVIAADVPDVIGTAFALNILFHIPVWAGVLCTGVSTLLLLGLQRYGARKLELLIAIFVFLLAACFFGEMSHVNPPAVKVIKGLFIPKLSGNSATGDAIALLGSIVMPHNLFLHSALVLSRKIPKSVRGINDACRYFLIETGFAMFIAFLVNVAIISMAGTLCLADDISKENADRCNNLTLNSASFLVKNVLGRSSSTIYGIALLASGQSSSITGTYAGQYIMQGFLDLKPRKWITNLITRCVAITPSVIAATIGGPAAAGRLIIIASMILSFELPFTLIPLLKFSSSSTKMGPHKNSIYIIVISWILQLGVIGINIYYLSTGFVDWLIHNNLPKVGNIFIGIIVFPFMAIYMGSIIYLIFRKDRVVTFIEPTMSDPTHMESGLEMEHAPYREDLADIPVPN